MKKFPHTYVIVFGIIILVAILTWIVPGGEFERKTIVVNGYERTVIDAHSFKYRQNEPQLWQVMSAFYQGFVNQAGIIVFILIIGGTFWIINTTKSIDIGIQSIINKIRQLDKLRFFQKVGTEQLILVFIMILFSLFGAIFGMSEETIAFIVIFVPLAISMGYDSIVGVSITYLAAHVGFASAMLNPFTIGIAQGISQIPLFSGIEYRFLCWVIINAVAIVFVLRYANRIKRTPSLSPMRELDKFWLLESNNSLTIEHTKPKAKQWIIFIVLSAIGIYLSFVHTETTIAIGRKMLTLPLTAFITAYFIISSAILLRKSIQYFILTYWLQLYLFLYKVFLGMSGI